MKDIYRITIIGSICHFVASLTTYNNLYNYRLLHLTVIHITVLSL